MEEDIAKEAERRLACCKRQKDAFRDDIEEAYFFVAPQRARSISSDATENRSGGASGKRPEDADLLQISIGMDEAENFATTLVTSFMPKGIEWIVQDVPPEVPEEIRGDFEDQAREQTKKVFDLIRASNFDAALAQSLNPDAAVGLHALMIRDPGRGKAVYCVAVPLRELEVDRDGTKFIVQHHKGRDVARVLTGIELPPKVAEKLKKRKESEFKVRWGWWPISERYDDEVWQHVVMVDKDVVHQAVLKGGGACELVAAPFNDYPEFAYGIGPAIRALPELRHLDDQAAAETENVDITLRPPFTYPDDSFANIEGGVEPGMGYPIRPGTAGDVKEMFQPRSLDAAFFDAANRERKVRRLFYNDMPEQRGDTPPTATQWVDEMAMAQRKIGLPGEVYWRKGPLEFFKRFKYIAAQRGLIEDNLDRPLTPKNPAQRAQDMQKASNAVRACEVAGSLFPEEFKLKVDGGATTERIVKLMGAEDVVVIRDEAQVQQAAGLIGQVIGGAAPGTPTAGAIPGLS